MGQLHIATNTNQAKQLSKRYQQKKIRKIYHGIYTDNLRAPIEEVVRQNWMAIVAHILPSGILSFRTAVELKPTPYLKYAIVFITSSYHKTITLPGLIIKVQKGNHRDYTEQVLPNLGRSNTARMLLENLTTVRGAQYKNIKTIGVNGVENYLAKELQLRHENHINRIRDNAKEMAASLGFSREYQQLNTMIGTLLSTNMTAILQSPYAKSVAKKEPFDNHRIQFFENFIFYLKKCRFKKRDYHYSKTTFRNIAFYESYFSNFIEGTEFLIDEAEDIAFRGIEINNRHADSHDILSHFTLSNDFTEMSVTPKSAKELLALLQERHAYLMRERPDKNPGVFKKMPNKAGSTHFVLPENVIGTLCRGFELYQLLENGLEKALFMHLMISEIHPFDDGNGRLSRVMMNAELVQLGLYKIIIPSVCRDNYLNGLRLASRDGNFRSYCKTIDQMQAYAASIPWADYGDTREKIEGDFANTDADEGLPRFNRVLRGLAVSEFAV